MTTPDIKRNWFFAACLLLLPGAASADNFEIYCRELNASPEKNLPSPYKAVWDGTTLTQIAADSNGKISESSEKVIAAKHLPAPSDKGLKYSFVTGIQEHSKNRFLTNISVEPSVDPDDFTVSVSYAMLDSDGFLIYAFEVDNEKCALTKNAVEINTTPGIKSDRDTETKADSTSDLKPDLEPNSQPNPTNPAPP
jgi:hypothetical protein